MESEVFIRIGDKWSNRSDELAIIEPRESLSKTQVVYVGELSIVLYSLNLTTILQDYDQIRSIQSMQSSLKAALSSFKVKRTS